MNKSHILATADDFTTITKAVAAYFKNPYPALKLKLITPNEWQVCRPDDDKPYGAFHHFYVVRQGIRYRLESRMTRYPPAYPKPIRGEAA